MTETRQCKKCGATHPLTRDHFGSTKSGGFRWQCRRCMAAATRQWAKANPDRTRTREQRRQKLNDGFVITDELKRRLLRQQHNVCALCGTTILGLTGCDVDHLIPLAKGGSNRESNLVAAHRHCNREKSAKTLREYYRWRQLNHLPLSKFHNDKTIAALDHETRSVS